LLYMINL